MATFWSRFMTGITAFRQAYMYPDENQASIVDDWGDWEARRLRYAVYEAFYNNSAYETVNRWSKKMKADYGLYKYTRGVYNPTFRLISFYETYIWGGRLDSAAGDGGALPIITDDDRLREAIAQIWKWSNWHTKRLAVPRSGALLGDVFLRVVDDAERGRVYLESVKPSTVKGVATDNTGNVKGYTIEYQRDDDSGKGTATFTETVERDGDEVATSLYKNGKPHAWDGYPQAQWSAPYGFVPMVHIQNRDHGLGWGLSELAPRLQAFMEVDDQASKSNDQIRKIVDPVWVLAGVNPPVAPPAAPTPAATTNDPQKAREVSKFLYAPDGATPHALVAPLDIEAVGGNIERMLRNLESDYPELALHRLRSESSDPSGRAVRLLRGEVKTKAEQKRDIYDDSLVRAQQMAVAIGGWRGYFPGFGLESYAAGELDHQIGQRDVFIPDPMEAEEYEALRLANLRAATSAGYPLDVYMGERDYPEEEIKAVVDSPEYQARLAMMQMALEPTADG